MLRTTAVVRGNTARPGYQSSGWRPWGRASGRLANLYAVVACRHAPRYGRIAGCSGIGRPCVLMVLGHGTSVLLSLRSPSGWAPRRSGAALHLVQGSACARRRGGPSAGATLVVPGGLPPGGVGAFFPRTGSCTSASPFPPPPLGRCRAAALRGVSASPPAPLGASRSRLRRSAWAAFRGEGSVPRPSVFFLMFSRGPCTARRCYGVVSHVTAAGVDTGLLGLVSQPAQVSCEAPGLAYVPTRRACPRKRNGG